MPYKDKEIAKEKSKARWKVWRLSHPIEANARMKRWRHKNPKYMLHASAKRRALRDGLEFTLTLETIPDIPDLCPIASIPIFPRDDGTKGPCSNSPTLDRVNTTLGYTPDNVRVVSHAGNRMKSNLTRADLERLILYMKDVE